MIQFNTHHFKLITITHKNTLLTSAHAHMRTWESCCRTLAGVLGILYKLVEDSIGVTRCMTEKEKMKKYSIFALALVMGAMTLTSCEDAFGNFLDKQPSNGTSGIRKPPIRRYSVKPSTGISEFTGSY